MIGSECAIPDPPGVLFVRGQIQPSDGLAVAIVGTRHGSQYGLDQAQRLAGGLARCGYTIVSGLARGIDAAAHRGALKAGGRTLAILGSGVLNIYPPEHESLANEITLHGAVISENAPRSPPLPGAFPQRNHHWTKPGRDRRGSFGTLRGVDFRAACHGARPRGVRIARPRR